MSDPIRYGIIGTGMMGCEHILNIALLPDAQVTAISDRNATSRTWGETCCGGNVEIYEDHRELLRKARVDAVVVATPNFTHAEVLRDVFATRVHVLVEKPLCTTIDDCRRVVDAAAVHLGIVWCGMQYRFMRPVARVREAVVAGAIGRPRMIAIREHRLPFLQKVDNWNRFARNTGGTLVEKCCHFFDLMNLVSGQRPLRVYASGAQDVNHLDEDYAGEMPDILDNAFVVVDFEGGIRGMLDLCMFAEGSTHEMELAVTGDRGKAEGFLPAHTFVLSRRDGSPRETVELEIDRAVRMAGAHHGATYFEHEAFAAAIRSGGTPQVSAHDGLMAVAVGAAAEQSAREKRPMELSELGV